MKKTVWLARNNMPNFPEFGTLRLFLNKPEKIVSKHGVCWSCGTSEHIPLDESEFPNVSSDDLEPTKAELIVKIDKNEHISKAMD